MNRREFLIQTGAVVAGGMLGGCANMSGGPVSGRGKSVSIITDPKDAVASAKPSKWAVEQFQRALVARGFQTNIRAKVTDASPSDFCVVVGQAVPVAGSYVGGPPSWTEQFTLASTILGGRQSLNVNCGDARAAVYALTDLADAVTFSDDPITAMQPSKAVTERPATKVRSVMRLFASDIHDKPWFNDRDFWQRYLSMLAAARFNRFNLALGLSYDAATGLRDTYFYFAYPFLLSVPGYNVRANNLPDSERDRNLEMLRFISDETAARGMQFQLGLWTHAYQWRQSPNANYVIEGLTPQTQAPYSRDALAIILKECPNITGVTFRIHGESGVPEGSYDLWRTIFDGCVRSGRPVEIDMHAKGMDQQTIDVALSTKLPITISPKYWAEHMGLPYHQAGIRAMELPRRDRGGGDFAQSNGARSFLRYGYGDLLKEDRPYGIIHRIWPGTQRVLLWGDPKFASAYGKAMSFCGSLGGEIFDPLSFKGRKGSGLPGSRDGYADESLRPAGGDFEKYLYLYRLWGRMMFNPDTKPEVWQRQLKHEYGPAADAVEKSLAPASRILPLFTTAHTPAAANNNYWPEMYVNMPIISAAPQTPYGPTESPAPGRFGSASPLDPQLFSRADDYADELLKGETGGKYSPIEVAQWLEDLSKTAAENLAQAEKKTKDRSAPAFRRFAIDVGVQIGLGKFFAEKFRTAVLYAIYDRTGDKGAMEEAIKAYKAGRDAWVSVSEITKDVYVKDMTYGDGWFQRGNWGDRLAAIDKDIAAMEQALAAPKPRAADSAPDKIAAMVREVLARPKETAVNAKHSAPSKLNPGQPVQLELAVAGPKPKQVQLFYRHAQQAEAWNALPMEAQSGKYHAAIPGEYSNSPYPLEYYFVIHPEAGKAAIHPGLGPELTNQPYYVLRTG